MTETLSYATVSKHLWNITRNNPCKECIDPDLTYRHVRVVSEPIQPGRRVPTERASALRAQGLPVPGLCGAHGTRVSNDYAFRV